VVRTRTLDLEVITGISFFSHLQKILNFYVLVHSFVESFQTQCFYTDIKHRSRYPLYDITTWGFHKENFDVIVNGVVKAIQMAHNGLVNGKILINTGIIWNLTNIKYFFCIMVDVILSLSTNTQFLWLFMIFCV
jgi:hypothetical protein